MAKVRVGYKKDTGAAVYKCTEHNIMFYNDVCPKCAPKKVIRKMRKTRTTKTGDSK